MKLHTNPPKKHIESAHEDIKPFKCNICEYETAHKAGLKKHVDFVHEGIKPYLQFEMFMMISNHSSTIFVNMTLHIRQI